MRFLYIGQYSDGTTSKMRCDTLVSILKPKTFEIIDTHIPFYEINPFWRSFGFRLKRGPIIAAINNYILSQLEGDYDLIWVDKAVFVTEGTTAVLRKCTKLLVHYTPDTAFITNASKHFERSLGYYDYAMTTKSFEINAYKPLIPSEKLILVPQGFDKNIHHSSLDFEDKETAIAFIGLCEPSREVIIRSFLNAGLKVYLAGKGWNRFANKHESTLLNFLGEGLFGASYAHTIARCKFAWGAVSKRFPELHTTRTFEIPACGTALLTETNDEISSFFKDDEVIFYRDKDELLLKINYYLQHNDALKQLTYKGRSRVINDGYDYDRFDRDYHRNAPYS